MYAGLNAVEHEKMVEAYSLMNQKLQNSFAAKANLEKTIQELKVFDGTYNFFSFPIHPLPQDPLPFLPSSDFLRCIFLQADLRRHERDYNLAQKEIFDLQKQVKRK